MADDENRFEPRLGRMRSAKGRRSARSFHGQVIERLARAGVNPRKPLGIGGAAPSSGRCNARGRGGISAGRFGSSSGWSRDPLSGMRVRARRVTVKARVVKLAGSKATSAAAAHLRYVQRDGVTREGEQGRLYSTFTDDADGKAFLERGDGDRHQFRFIVSPEDGAALENLRGFTRDLMAKMEEDLRTNLDWVAVDHFDTGHPHTHVLVRGVTEDGKTLNIAGDYIAHGIRGRASEIMTQWLGPQSELEVQEQLAREVDADRLTTLDKSLIGRAQEGVVDLRQEPGAWDGEGSYQQLLISRARKLERMELAEREGPLSWRLSGDAEKTLRDLGRRRDIIATIHRAMTAAKLARRPELYVIDGLEAERVPVVGKVVHRGPADDDHDRRCLVIDGIDGRTHYVDVGRSTEPTAIGSVVRVEPVTPQLRKADVTIAAVAGAWQGKYSLERHLLHDKSASIAFAEAHIRRLEALRRAGVGVERDAEGTWRIPSDYTDQVLEHERRAARAVPVRIQVLARLELEAEAVNNAPSWLDDQLRQAGWKEIPEHGYGKEVLDALHRRQEWLIKQALVEVQDGMLQFDPDMDAKLRQRELRALGAQLSKELGLEWDWTGAGEQVSGICRRRVDTSSGSYALVERSREFSLVPWRPELERAIGREITGRIRSSGGISWTLGRERSGPEIGM
jgi:type IV secretory pathway VirD2 relaxase